MACLLVMVISKSKQGGKNMSKKLRVGLIGLGHWYFAYAVARHFPKSELGTLLAVSDPDERVIQFSREFGIPEYTTDYRKIIERPDIDAVIVTTPTAETPRVVMEALAAGKHVFSGKPMARTVKEAEEVVRAEASSGKRVFVLHGTWKYWPMHQTVKQLLEDGTLGDLISAKAFTRAPLPQKTPNSTDPGWFADPSQAAGGAFVDHGVYHLDLLQDLFGSKAKDIKPEVLQNLRYKELELEDYGLGVVNFENGMSAVLEETWIGAAFAAGLEVRGTKGDVIADTARRPAVLLRVQGQPDKLIDVPEANSDSVPIEAYLDALVNEKPAPTSAEQGCQILGVFEELYRKRKMGPFQTR